MFDRPRKTFARFLTSTRAAAASGPQRRPHNLFEAAAVYVSARAEDDQERIDEAAGWVSPEALSFGSASWRAGPSSRSRGSATSRRGRWPVPSRAPRDLTVRVTGGHFALRSGAK